MYLKFSFYIFIFFYLLIQILSLAYSPLPWFDETFFASLAWNFIQTGNFQVPVAVFKEEVKLYGFVYFLLTGLSLKILGFGIFSFRLVNLLMGLSVVYLSYKLLIINHLHYKKEKTKTHFLCYVLFIICFLTDPLFYLCLHEGRMDLTAIFFILLGIFQLVKGFQTSNISNFIYSGIFCVLALLTTPRSSFILLAMGLFFIFWTSKAIFNNYKYLIIWGLSIFSLYTIWIFYAFGNPIDFANYYFQMGSIANREESYVSLFLGWNGYIPKSSFALIIIACFSALYGVYLNKKNFFNPLAIIGLLSIFLFYWLIFDYGQYSIFIIPFYYLLIFNTLQSIQKPIQQTPFFYVILILLIYNLSYFTLKNLQVFDSLTQRDYHLADEFIKKHIPAHSRVVGEPMFFYSVIKNGSDYQYFDLYETLEKREKIQREIFKYQYLLITDHTLWRNKTVVDYYLKQAKFKKIARLEIPQSHNLLIIKQLNLLSNTERTGYNCTIYKIE